MHCHAVARSRTGGKGKEQYALYKSYVSLNVATASLFATKKAAGRWEQQSRERKNPGLGIRPTFKGRIISNRRAKSRLSRRH